MEERHISQLVQNLFERFGYLGENAFNLNDELHHLAHPITREAISNEILHQIENRFLERIRYRRAHDGAILIPVSMVSDPRGHEEWYEDWLDEHNNETDFYYWKRLENFLEAELTHKYNAERAGRIVRSIDDATTRIMQKLANPVRNEFSYKGLVVGYVQSGKTANFTALIAKAADAGYKIIIVLAGIHNVLRRQTQIRLDRELTGENDLNLDNFIDLPGAAKRWNRLTTSHNDFSTVNLGPFSTFCRVETPSLAVIKKNVRVLNGLIDYISQCPQELRGQNSVLVIDDEADQASIDTNANTPDSDPSRTNECIRRLLTLFSKKAYIGYTATPFANVLINMATEHNDLEDDLYPRNFIVSLPAPDGYFGTTRIFQGNLSARFVKEIPDEGNELIRHATMTQYLSDAIDQFIICSAVRNLRGDRMKPMTMLVHISRRINDMRIIRLLTEEYVGEISRQYASPRHSQDLKDQWELLWNDIGSDAVAINAELGTNNMIPEFNDIWGEVRNIFEILRVIELNSASEDRLDYTVEEEIKVIAVGGDQLSRGLTLDGLMTSYYLRQAGQYDTLLQMGRWFGYRQGYEDLTRIHTTAVIWDFFEHLALVEHELRSEIYRYEEENRTPAQLAVAIRDHRNLTVTSLNKMGAARLKQISYSESLNQTIWLPIDQPEVLTTNYDLGDSFISAINQEVGFTNHNGVFLSNASVEGNRILHDFLNRYSFADHQSTGGAGLDVERLLAYIFRRLNDQQPELTQWNVALVGNVNPTADGDPVSYGNLQLNRIQRSRKHTARGFNIGVLTEPDHLKIDLRENASSPFDGRSSQNPLLLLYLVWSESRASQFIQDPVSDQRIDLFRFLNSERVDVLGIAMVLPRSQYEPNNYVGQ